MTARPLPEAVEREINAVVKEAGMAYTGRINALPNALDDLRHAIAAALAPGEPVAWGVFNKNDCLWRSFDTQREAEREVGYLNHRDDAGHYRACGPYIIVPLYRTPPAPPASVERRMAFLGVEAKDARIARLEAALRPFADMSLACEAPGVAPDDEMDELIWEARAALDEGSKT